MEEQLHAALSEIIRTEYPDSLVTHFTAVATLVTAEGGELVVTLDRPEQPMWQSMGMIDFLREMRRAMIANSVADQPEDD